jgi:O-methyltransferase involved in polyketide biosynthesis
MPTFFLRCRPKDATMEKQKIRLTEEKETLLIPLYSKALESQRPHPILVDRKAEEILQGIEYDFGQLKVPKKTLLTLAMRAKKLDSVVQAYLARSQDPLVLHLGCGLDSRVIRVGHQKGDWYDLDFPDVIELRRRFYPETDRYHLIPSSVTDLDWLEQVKADRPACIIAEGLLMYLHEGQVKALFTALQERLPESELACDVYSRLTAKSAKNHPSLKKTGAQINWGIDDARQIESWGRGIKLVEEWYFSDSEDIDGLGPLDRFMFKVIGGIKAAQKAHRILRFRL